AVGVSDGQESAGVAHEGPAVWERKTSRSRWVKRESIVLAPGCVSCPSLRIVQVRTGVLSRSACGGPWSFCARRFLRMARMREMAQHAAASMTSQYPMIEAGQRRMFGVTHSSADGPIQPRIVRSAAFEYQLKRITRWK